MVSSTKSDFQLASLRRQAAQRLADTSLDFLGDKLTLAWSTASGLRFDEVKVLAEPTYGGILFDRGYEIRDGDGNVITMMAPMPRSRSIGYVVVIKGNPKQETVNKIADGFVKVKGRDPSLRD